MDFNEIQELIRLVNKSNLTDFSLKDKDFEIKIRTKKYYKGASNHVVAPPQMVAMPQAISQPVAAPSVAPATQGSDENAAPAKASEASSGKNIIEIKSPIVGTFYRSAGSDKPLFTKVGDQVNQGDVVCIIEAMKLFNEIESEITGTIVKVLVEDASPVEYDQVLFLVEV
jgi:acetyl-CoA carboxylase biotin carboxyl carrier protein